MVVALDCTKVAISKSSQQPPVTSLSFSLSGKAVPEHSILIVEGALPCFTKRHGNEQIMSSLSCSNDLAMYFLNCDEDDQKKDY